MHLTGLNKVRAQHNGFHCEPVHLKQKRRGTKNISLSGNLANGENFLSVKSHYVMQNVFAGHDELKKVQWLFQPNRRIKIIFHKLSSLTEFLKNS